MADYLKQTGLAKRGAVIGYDTRFASEDFAAASAEVLAGNSIKVYLCPQATPTPVISYGILAKRAGGGIIITASHNPAKYNGFKIKSMDGASASTEVIAEIEKNITQVFTIRKYHRTSLPEAIKKQLIEYYDIYPDYIRKISTLIDIEAIKQAEIKIIVDSMYGAGSGYFKKMLSGGKIEIEEINGEYNPAFPGIRPEPIADNLAKLASTVKRRSGDVGLATDGDADRIGIIDENGVFLTQLQVNALLALYLLEVRGERGAIVKSITTTHMLDRLGEIYNVPVFETKVGFKYIAPVMIRENAMLGGEESGGYGFRGHIPERDGILAGLYFLDFMIKTGKTPSQLLGYLYNKVGPHFYQRIDRGFPEKERAKIMEKMEAQAPSKIEGIPVIKRDTSDGFRFVLKDGSWLLVRFSGTEPLLRIYAESESMENVKKLLSLGKKMTGVK
jgi:phosphomannomutase